LAKRKPSLGMALLPVIVAAVTLYVGIVILEADAHIPLIISAIVAAFVGMSLGYDWKEMEDAVIESIMMAMQACVILMILGCIIGSWIGGGVIQSLIFYGLQILRPSYFLAAVCLICCIISLATGSSWTTAGTMGIAALGIGYGLGVPPAVTAGAVISGAYFGDKMSPLSDTTNLAPAMAGSELFEHISHMIYTTGPALIISLILYFVVGLRYAGGELDYTRINEILTVMSGEFWISPILLIAPALVIVMVVLKIPAIPGLIGATGLGAIFSFVQGFGLADVVDFIHYGYASDTGHEMVDELLSRGGLDGMMWTISLIIVALAFGGILEKTGCLETIINSMAGITKTRGSMILVNVITCILVNFIAADQYIAIVVPGRMFKPLYDEMKLHPKNLSRVLEDAGTMTSALVPWNTCGAFMHTTLGIHPFAFFPYAFLNILCPIISVFYGYTGITMEYVTDEAAAS